MKINTQHIAGPLLALAAALLSNPNTNAATLTVTGTADSGPGSLRAALAAAVNGDTIDATGVSGAVTLTTGELLITNSVTILGPGPVLLSVDGNAATRVFHITNAATVAISGLTVTNGAVSGSFPGNVGGGIWNDHSSLTLSNCTITYNNGGNGFGGSIYNDGSSGNATLSIIASTISRNYSLAGSGGGIMSYGYAGSATISIIASTINNNSAGGSGNVGGGIFNDGNSGSATLTLTNCTFYNNVANQDGGGVYNGGASGTGVVVAIACTFNGNIAAAGNFGANIYNNGAGGKLQIGNTILVGSTIRPSINNGAGGVITTLGYNLCSDNGSGFLTNATDQVNSNPQIGPLADNGGPTWTSALLSNSPAIDKGKSFGLITDQRGEPRSFDWPSFPNATGGDASDIGAFELGNPTLNIQQIGTNAVLSWPSYYGNGEFSLQSSINIASSNSWIAAGGSPAVVGSQYQQTNSPISGSKFFRLKSN